MLKSKDNPLIKKIRKLLAYPRFREEQREFVLEGFKIIHDTLSGRFSSAPFIRTLLFSTRTRAIAGNKVRDLMALASRKGIPIIEVSDSLMDRIKSRHTNQEVIALAKWIDQSLEEVIKSGIDEMQEGVPLFIGLCGVQDPGNLGALIRTAHAGSATAVLVFEGCADVYNPRTVRGSMGSLFAIPIVRSLTWKESLALLKKKEIRIYATSSAGSLRYTEVDFQRPSLILFGSEGKGIPESYLDFTDGSICIPMAGGVDSLNVNASAAIILYERLRKLSIS
ncbi:MAG: RNA methyltransferase [Acidobacteriota bacterium]